MLSSGNGWDQPFDFGLGNLGAVISGANAGPGERVMITNPELAAIFGRPVGQTINYDSLSDPQRSAMLEEERQRKKRMEEIAKHELNNKWKKMAMYTAGLATAGYAFGAGGPMAVGSGTGAAASAAAPAATGGTAASTSAAGGGFGASSLGLSSGATPVAGMGSAFGAGGSAGLGTASAGLATGGGGAAALGGAAASAAPASAAATTAGGSGWLSGAMKWTLANKNWISGLLTAVGTAYSQSNQKKQARKQYDYANSVLQQQRDYYAQQQEAARNSPVARMSGPLMDAVLQMYAERLGRYNVNLPLQEILGGIRQATGRG